MHRRRVSAFSCSTFCLKAQIWPSHAWLNATAKADTTSRKTRSGQGSNEMEPISARASSWQIAAPCMMPQGSTLRRASWRYSIVAYRIMWQMAHQTYSRRYMVATASLQEANGSGARASGQLRSARWCQTNSNQSPLFADQQVSGSDQLAPFEQSGVT